jgi:hypothetical protein
LYEEKLAPFQALIAILGDLQELSGKSFGKTAILPIADKPGSCPESQDAPRTSARQELVSRK